MMQEVILYTDGACKGNPGPGGWAFVLEHPASSKVSEGSGGSCRTTNNRMELLAVVSGLESLKTPCRVRLVSDSQYVIKGLTEWMKGWKAKGWKRREKGKLKPVKNEDLWKRLDALWQTHEGTTEWVRGHTGHPQNERCDALACDVAARAVAEGLPENMDAGEAAGGGLF